MGSWGSGALGSGLRPPCCVTLAKPLEFSGIIVKFTYKMKRMIQSLLRVLATLARDSKFLPDLLTALLSQLLLLELLGFLHWTLCLS